MNSYSMRSTGREFVRTFEMNDYLTTGMSFGDLCTLTGEEMFIQCVCDTAVQVSLSSAASTFSVFRPEWTIDMQFSKY